MSNMCPPPKKKNKKKQELIHVTNYNAGHQQVNVDYIIFIVSFIEGETTRRLTFV